MKSDKVKRIIVRYLSNTATKEDLNKLSLWLSNDSNKKEFQDFVKTHYLVAHSFDNFDTNNEIDKVLSIISSKGSRKGWTKKYFRYSYAVAFLILALMVSVPFVFNFNGSEVNDFPIVYEETSVPDNNDAILTTGDGTEVILGNGVKYSNIGVKGDEEKIVYNSESDADNYKEDVFNYLTIPRGGQYYIEMSDDTKIWLNSESKIKFPVVFKKGQPRIVELLYGEAYFEVSPSSENNGSEFIVKNAIQEVTVLGTIFNIKAYKDDRSIYTTLVEGRVNVTSASDFYEMEPKEQVRTNVNLGAMTIRKVNVDNEVSWKWGVYNFKGQSLKEIMKVISRWYDIDVIFLNKELEDQKFVGKINRNFKLEDILSTMKSTEIINTFELTDSTVKLR
ncbi:FecR family protein [Winogradskyella bathintestinalis]|uniref:FecR family protein n=1 Tax=Winogradskyella bathintestinalis TaxID=3035208 RepID=A0ABT7ZWM3_9FLAO|nr:FecR family protein [Winogradskyella bathintestinalis]MDN3493390.1 FecR family protein [Winogradskyella bathintestinalis]